jgi:hypothetical protein
MERINRNIQNVAIARDDFQTAVLMNHVKYKKKERNAGLSAVKHHFIIITIITIIIIIIIIGSTAPGGPWPS